MRILFAGTPEIAVPSLTSLLEGRHTVAAVLTAQDRRSGRGRKLAPSPVKSRALDAGIPVVQPERLGRDAREMVLPSGAELLVCVAYGRIFGPRFLELFAKGGINLHPSLLPRFRGPSPIPAAILAGDSVTGVTIQRLAREMDAGDILAQETIALSGNETTGDVTERVAVLGADLLSRVVDEIEDGTVSAVAQDESRATYSHLISKADGQINWKDAAVEIDRAVRAYNPWPLAHTFFRGERLNILQAEPIPAPGPGISVPGTVVAVDNARGILIETGNGRLAVARLQLQSRKALSWDAFLNGVRDFIGAVLGV